MCWPDTVGYMCVQVLSPSTRPTLLVLSTQWATQFLHNDRPTARVHGRIPVFCHYLTRGKNDEQKRKPRSVNVRALLQLLQSALLQSPSLNV